ncbi:MAG: multicopper oxidase domain-containing protein [Candidatus Baltobacteraceae bacterium]
MARDGDRFCYRYTLAGAGENRAPILRVRRGERFALRIVNELDGPAPGATMAASAIPRCMPQPMPSMLPVSYVGYMNHPTQSRAMPMKDVDANVHLHGFQGSPEQENVFLSTLSTPARACEYDVTVPRTQPPGTYFYHTHAHEMSGDEVAGGLGGMWIVEPDEAQLSASDEHAIVLRYRIPFVGDDQFTQFMPSYAPLFLAGAAHASAQKPAAPAIFDPFNPPPWPATIPIRAGNLSFHGRCGSRPGELTAVDDADAPGQLTVPAGEPQLLRVLNATSDSFEKLHLRGASGQARSLAVVGRDGTPVGGDDAHPLARYLTMNQLVLPPAGRADVLLTLAPDEVVTLYAVHECTAPGDEHKALADLLVIRAAAPAAAPAAIASTPLDASRTPAMQLVQFARTHPRAVRRRAITYTEYVLPNARGKGIHPEYYITETSKPDFRERPYWPAYAEGARTPAADIVVKHGSIEEWDLFNATMESHSFHIHQMSFVAEDQPAGPAMLDTVMLPFGSLLANPKDRNYPLIKPSRTRVLLDFRNVPRGTFVFHCHMLFHEDHGMMKIIRVE